MKGPCHETTFLKRKAAKYNWGGGFIAACLWHSMHFPTLLLSRYAVLHQSNLLRTASLHSLLSLSTCISGALFSSLTLPQTATCIVFFRMPLDPIYAKHLNPTHIPKLLYNPVTLFQQSTYSQRL